MQNQVILQKKIFTATNKGNSTVTYGTALENNFKLNNKIENKEDLSFINLDFNKIKECVIVNKLYENKISNYIRELSEKKTSLQNNLRSCEIEIENKLNSLQYLKDEQKNRVKKELKELRDKLEKINESIKNIEKELDELLNLTSYKNINYYNYTIIKGIRDSLAHGNITYKNIYYNDVKDTLIEFTDYYRNEIKFKLTIRINDLIYLFENKNIDVLNNFYNEKVLKKSTKQYFFCRIFWYEIVLILLEYNLKYITRTFNYVYFYILFFGFG